MTAFYDDLERRSEEERDAALARDLPHLITLAKTKAAHYQTSLADIDAEKITSREALAAQLLAQERVRFFEGVSDQFLLIAREKATLQASLQRIDAELDILRNELALHATLAQLF